MLHFGFSVSNKIIIKFKNFNKVSLINFEFECGRRNIFLNFDGLGFWVLWGAQVRCLDVVQNGLLMEGHGGMLSCSWPLY